MGSTLGLWARINSSIIPYINSVRSFASGIRRVGFMKCGIGVLPELYLGDLPSSQFMAGALGQQLSLCVAVCKSVISNPRAVPQRAAHGAGTCLRA